MSKINNINRREFLEIFGYCSCGLIMTSCTTAPITDRKQLRLIPEHTINKQAMQIYEQVKIKAKLSNDKNQLNEIIGIGSKIEKAVSAFFVSNNKEDPTTNFQWEYILIDNDKIKNAWCMPGGKIAVYTGMLDITKNTNGLAAVMGHEIAHAVAKHSIERASRNVAVNVVLQVTDVLSGGKLSQVNRTTGVNTVDLLTKMGIVNPFNRKQESEADYLGLIFASLSGYDIRETINIWDRMKKANKGKIPPEFMSTHPSPENRKRKIENWIPEITLKYPPIST